MENTEKLTPEIARRIQQRMVDAMSGPLCDCEPTVVEVEGHPGILQLSCPHINVTASRDEFERMVNSGVISQDEIEEDRLYQRNHRG